MFKRKIFFTYTLYLHYFRLYAFNEVICPSEQLWYLRAQSLCTSVEKYTCLLDSINSIHKESCKGPRSEPPGDKTVINSGNFDTESCSNDRFQPFPFSTSQGNDCIFMKTLCHGEGQIVHRNGTNQNDRECRCDYTRSFIFLSNMRQNRCSCDPITEDCSCFMKFCGKGEILSPDYSCIKKEDSYGKFVCEEIDITQGQTTDGTLREIKVGDRYESITKETAEERTGAIISMTFTGIMIAAFICLFLKPWIKENIFQIFNTGRNPDPLNKDFEQKYHSDDRRFDESMIPLALDHKSNQLNDFNEDDASKPSVDNLPRDFDKTVDDGIIEAKTTAGISKLDTNTGIEPLRLSHTSKEIQKGNDKCMAERDECAYEISEEVLEVYKNDPYSRRVLNDLIDRKVIYICKSQEGTTAPHTKEEREKAEHAYVQTTINKQRNNDNILRRNVDKSFGNILDDLSVYLKSRFKSGIKEGYESLGHLIGIEQL